MTQRHQIGMKLGTITLCLLVVGCPGKNKPSKPDVVDPPSSTKPKREGLNGYWLGSDGNTYVFRRNNDAVEMRVAGPETRSRMTFRGKFSRGPFEVAAKITQLNHIDSVIPVLVRLHALFTRSDLRFRYRVSVRSSDEIELTTWGHEIDHNRIRYSAIRVDHDSWKIGLRRASDVDCDPIATAVNAGSGSNEGKKAGTWGRVTTSTIKTRKSLGAYSSEAAAVAAAKGRNKPAAIIIERGKYVVYDVDVDSVVPFNSTMASNVKRSPETHAIVTSDGEVIPKFISGGAEYIASEDPFAGYREAFGTGLECFPGREKCEFLDTFGAAMKSLALVSLTKSAKEIDALHSRFAVGVAAFSAAERLRLRAAITELASIERRVGTAKPPTAAELRAANADRKKLTKRATAADATAELRKRRQFVLLKWPMLARFKAATLKGMSDEAVIAKFAEEARTIRAAIDTTRKNVLDGDLNLWAVDQVVDATIAGLGIRDPWMRDCIRKRAREESLGVVVKGLTLATIQIALSIAASVTTGGLSLALWSGALGVGVYDAADVTNRWSAEKDAGNTNEDPERGLVPPDLAGHWGWLVLAWVGVLGDASAVVTAVRAVKRTGRIAAAQRILANKDPRKWKRLLRAAGINSPDEIISEASRLRLQRRLGVRIEIDQTLGEGVDIVPKIDARGRIQVDVVRVGKEATTADVLFHRRTIENLRRYDTITVKARRLWDRFRSFGGKKPNTNPFPAGSAAHRSWEEVSKLNDLVAFRRSRLKGRIDDATARKLADDVRFFESEILHHQKVVDEKVLEKGSGVISRPARSNKAAIAAGYPKPKDPSKYYYVKSSKNDGTYVLRRYKDAKKAPPLQPEMKGGKPTGKFVDGKPNRAERAQRIVDSWDTKVQDKYKRAVKDAKAKYGDDVKVVPLKGIKQTKTSLGDLMSAKKKKELKAIIEQQLDLHNVPGAKAKAEAAIKAMDEYKLKLISGTDQLRAHGYRAKWKSPANKNPEELHHLIPLYLGGHHKLLVDLPEHLHDKLHKVIDGLEIAGRKLDPTSVGAVNKQPGYAVLFKDGTIKAEPLR